MKKITKLTPEQEAILPVVRDEWLQHGLSTEPADRPAAEEGVRMAYRAAGLEPPRFMIWLGSPMAGVYGQAIAGPIVTSAMRHDQVDGQVYGQVYDQVHGQVHGQVYDQVHGQVDGQVDGQVHDQVYDQVYDQVDDQVDGQVHDQVYDQVDGQVDGQVYDQVHGQVRDQVRGQVRDQVRGQVRDQVHGQVRDQVHGQVHGQVYDQVHGQVYDQVHGQVDGQVDGQVHDQVDGQVRDQVYGQVRDQVYDQVDGQVRDQVRDQVYGQVHDQVDGQVDGQVYGQVRDQVKDWWRARISGQHWAGYYSWLDAMERIGVTGVEPIHGQQQVARTSGWWFPFRNYCVLTERPNQLHRDPQGRLHNAAGPAISYPDGWAIYAWHGTRVESWVIDPSTSIERIMAEKNAEVRRCAIEFMGWDRFENRLVLVSECDDPGNPGQLLRLMDFPADWPDLYDDNAKLLLCTNGTVEPDGTRRRFGLPVPAHHTDPVVAVAEMYDWPVEAYKQLARRA